MTEYLVEHIEYATVEAENKDNARKKALEGDTILGYSDSTYNIVDEEAGEMSKLERLANIREIIRKYDSLTSDIDMDTAITKIRRLAE